MGDWKYLSYPLGVATQGYGGGNIFFQKEEKRIVHGDSCNQQQWSFSNHAGTHIDFPRHFGGKEDLDSYLPSFWISHKTVLLDLSHSQQSVQPNQIVSWQDLLPVLPAYDVEFLFIKTGFCQFRAKDVYWRENPGFSPELAKNLKEHFPSLRIFGFDVISLTSWGNRPLGRLAHKAFLNSSQPILLLEDMNLEFVNAMSNLHQVIVSPLFVQGADATPCTVLAFVEQKSK